MSDAPREERSFLPITDDVLRALATIAAEEISVLCRPGNVSAFYRDRLLLLCLCQGSALHHLQKQTGAPLEACRGIHDFDVWAFFEREPGRNIAYRGTRERDFGSSRFGKTGLGWQGAGRKVDICVRAIDRTAGQTPVEAVLAWIDGRGDSPRLIRERPVFVISAGPDFGRCIWTP